MPLLQVRGPGGLGSLLWVLQWQSPGFSQTGLLSEGSEGASTSKLVQIIARIQVLVAVGLKYPFSSSPFSGSCTSSSQVQHT